MATPPPPSPSPPAPCPEETANLLSWITFSWISPLLRLGSKRPLDHADLYELPEASRAATVTPAFRAVWAAEEAKGAASEAASPGQPRTWYRPSLAGALLTLAGRLKMVLVLFFALVQAGAPFAGPLLLRAIIRFLASDEPEWHGIVYAILLGVVPWIGTVLASIADRLLLAVGMANLTAANNAVYWKALRMSAGARLGTSTGEIVQLMSTDAMRLFRVTHVANEVIATPIQIVVALGLLWEQLGPSVLAGVAVILFFIPFNARIGSKLTTLTIAKMRVADERVKLMNEILAGIRVLKYHAYELPFIARVRAIRDSELDLVRAISNYTASLMFGIILSPTLIFLASIITFAAAGNTLTVERVFVSMALFNLLRMPLSNAPMMVIQVVVARTSAHRLEAFFAKRDAASTRLPVHPFLASGIAPADLVHLAHGRPLDPQPPPPRLPPPSFSDAPVVARIVDGVFSWEHELTEIELYDAALAADADHAMASKAAAKAGTPAPAKPDTPPPPGPTLHGINLALPRGALVAVVGPVGSGKSSLVAALLGEMHVVSGAVAVVDSIAYVPQEAWIMNATLRDNILFGLAYDAAKYNAAVTAASLDRDLDILPAGDMTEIGERGINLSGGQKQRVSIARAVYADADIYVLDDPLSAVDSEVGKDIFDSCITGVLAAKTRLLTTNHLHHLPHADYVIALAADGSIAEQGAFADLLAADGPFARMYVQHMGDNDDNEHGPADADASPSPSASASALKLASMVSLATVTPDAAASIAALLTADTETGEPGAKAKSDASPPPPDGALTTAEERNTGAVRLKVYVRYLLAMGSLVFFVTYIALHTVAQTLTNGTDLWLSYWSSGWLERKTGKTYTLEFYLGILVALAVAQTVFVFLRELWWVRGAVHAARNLHDRLLLAVLASPMSFFDTTPIGRILNRFSKDTDAIDTQLPSSLNTYTLIIFLLLGMLVAICIIRWYYVFFVLPIGIAYYYIQGYFRLSSLELRRLLAISRSPIFQHFSETLTGVDTIRAYSRQAELEAENCRRLDANNQAVLYQEVANLWLRIRLTTLGQLLVLAAGLSVVLSRDDVRSGKLDPGLAAMAVSYSLSITGFMQFVVQIGTEVENLMNSVERVAAYSDLPSEAPARIAATEPPPEWPQSGAITLNKVSMRYRDGLPLVLSGVSATIRGNERIGVVGRSGAGKSSLMSVLFRLVEIEDDGGSVVVDGIDIGTIGLASLRARMAIIPQDPVLFAGTIRNNVDPFTDYPDDAVWRALELAMLKPTIAALDAGLAEPVAEGGSNFSVGERQLLCLARALLRSPRILVCDEASAAIDFDTDAAIQTTLRTAFVGATQLIIAHRINTIIDVDRVMVFDAGRLVEFDSPAALLRNPDGFFTRLVDATGPASAAQLRAMASANVSYLDLMRSALSLASSNDPSSLTMDDIVSMARGRAAPAPAVAARRVDSASEYDDYDYESADEPLDSSSYFDEYATVSS